MKRAYFIILLLILTSCALFKPAPKEAADILGGEGLVIKLPQIPKELFVGQGLEIPLTLENAGAYKVENAILSLSGYNPEFVKFRSLPKIEGINLEGRSQFVPVGERTTKVFTISSINLPSAKERTETFEAVACYPYKTEASPVVCINPQLVFGTEDISAGVCDFVDAKISPTQGAPIAVTKVETWYFIEQQEVEFRVFVKDVSGKGVVLNKNAYGKRCLGTEPLKPEDLNVVTAEIFLSGEQLSCYSAASEEPQNIFTLAENQYIRCRAKIDPAQPAYTTPLSVSLSYGYVTLQVFSINLKNPAFR